ncbi:carboxypeptidase Y inhibitor [Knufia peltigerae]|nr:carboxypeptidase Y inhibitor [Knufia peltigerae]
MLATCLACVCLLLATAIKTSASPIHRDQKIFEFPDATIIEPDLSQTSAIRDTLIANKIIGDVLDDFEPSYYIEIDYPSTHDKVVLGNDIPVDAVSERPVFNFFSMKPSSVETMNSTFTLVLTDPDAKSRDKPKWSEMCHWILTNLTTPTPGPPPGTLHAKPGEIMEYLPPGPPPKTGAHRYVFVLLAGDSSNLKAPKDRKHWGYGKVRHGVRDWAEENDLKVVGANFFFAQNEKQ